MAIPGKMRGTADNTRRPRQGATPKRERLRRSAELLYRARHGLTQSAARATNNMERPVNAKEIARDLAKWNLGSGAPSQKTERRNGHG